jgi:hypothetical protein
VFVERAVHGPEPFVALTCADRERQVPRAEARVAIALDVCLRPAGPVCQVEMEFVARGGETFGVERADGSRFGRAVDEIVESVDEPSNAGVAAD